MQDVFSMSLGMILSSVKVAAVTHIIAVRTLKTNEAISTRPLPQHDVEMVRIPED